jgi:hypothetical protein
MNETTPKCTCGHSTNRHFEGEFECQHFACSCQCFVAYDPPPPNAKKPISGKARSSDWVGLAAANLAARNDLRHVHRRLRIVIEGAPANTKEFLSEIQKDVGRITDRLRLALKGRGNKPDV